MKKYIVGLVVVVLVVAGVAVAKFGNFGKGGDLAVTPTPVVTTTPTGDEVACTQEAKQCPDGSYVGRTGPKCEFAVCPIARQPEPFAIVWPSRGAILVAGKTYTITWTGASPEVKGYDIYLRSDRQQALDGHQGTGIVSIIASYSSNYNPVSVSERSFSWTIPPSLQPGSDYFVDFGNIGHSSDKFTIISGQ